MWLMVMFDLPVTSKDERKRATAFRKSLLDMGFQMSQYSVYMRFCSAGSQIETLSSAIGGLVPEAGKVSVLSFTDKQYQRTINYAGTTRSENHQAPGQLELL